MADERKRRRWPWVVLALLVLYPLSYGIPIWLSSRSWIEPYTAYWLQMKFYRPIIWLSNHSETFREAEEWYVRLCRPPDH